MGQRPKPAPARHVLGKGLGSVGDEVELATKQAEASQLFWGQSPFYPAGVAEALSTIGVPLWLPRR